MNIRMLKSKMALHGETIKSMAEQLGIVHQTCSRKINGIVDFTQSEMSKIKKLCDLTDEEFAQIFTEVDKNEDSRCR